MGKALIWERERARPKPYGAARRLRKLALPLLIVAGGAAQAEPVTIAALGDSLTAGYGLPQGEGLVPQLQAWLDAQGVEAQVLNAGVSGDTSAGGLSRVAWTLTPEVDAMIVELGGNDYLRGIPPDTVRANIEGVLAAAEAAGVEVLLVGLPAAGNYGPDYQREFNAIFPDLAAEYDALLYPDFFAALSEGRDLQTAREVYLQSDGLHPNADGVALIVAALGPEVLQLIDSLE